MYPLAKCWFLHPDRRGVVTLEYLTTTQGKVSENQASSRSYGTVHTVQPSVSIYSSEYTV